MIRQYKALAFHPATGHCCTVTFLATFLPFISFSSLIVPLRSVIRPWRSVAMSPVSGTPPIARENSRMYVGTAMLARFPLPNWYDPFAPHASKSRPLEREANACPVGETLTVWGRIASVLLVCSLTAKEKVVRIWRRDWKWI